MKTNQQQDKIKFLSTQDIQKQILYWNINALNNITAYTALIDRVQKKISPTHYDLQIRDFYFTNKLTIDGKFQPQSFLETSIEFIKNFKSLDKNAYLQSINFQNNIKKYRFWKNVLNSVPKDKQMHQIRQKISGIVWAYRLPTFAVFSSFIYVFMMAVGLTKVKKGKQFAILMATMYAADVFIQRRRSSDIFYQITSLNVKDLEKERKQLINKSIILDGKIYQIQEKINYESKQLIDQAKYQQDQEIKKALLQAAGFNVIKSVDQVI